MGDDATPWVIYGYADGSCVWCETAKEVLLRHGVVAEFRDVKTVEVKKELFGRLARTAPKTVPQIFHGGEWVGGYQDLLRYLGVQPE